MIVDRNSPVPQYFQIQTWLREQIEQGVFRPEEKVPTEEELVKITGLARATIRQAFANLTNMGYLVRKRRLGTFVTLHSHSSQTKNIVGVIVPDIRSGYTPELARGVEDEAAKNKFSTILCNTDDLFVKADFHADRLLENSIGCVVFVPTAAPDEKNRIIIEKFRKRDVPIVLADRLIPNLDIDYVTTDNFEGAYGLTKYLIEKGHTRIGITLSTLFNTERLRLEGYQKALADSNIPYDPTIVALNDGPFNEKYYLQVARTLLASEKKISAIFAGHDRIAYLIYSVAKKMGISIPNDISLIGYDDLHPTIPNSVSLTTMHQPIYEMGQESLKILISRIKGETTTTQQIVLKSHFVERTSVISRKIT
ncbi:MAG: GntR family transcriptional regulator [Candidatus Marinimicrobia bacterium]|nr:GntR family transcriptional regulator [Candidatus Neomarinimicrobiota bacterium]